MGANKSPHVSYLILIVRKEDDNMSVLLFFWVWASIGTNTTFHDKVLSDFRINSVFIAVDIESKDYQGRAIINNDALYHFLRKTKGLDEEKYKAFMKDLLLSKSKLHVGDRKLNKWGFVKVQDSKEVGEHASIGIQALIGHYFRGRVIKDGIGDKERNALISKLFEYEVATRLDDETGFLVLAPQAGPLKAIVRDQPSPSNWRNPQRR